MERVIGIELGTANAAVAVMKDGQPVLVPDEQGKLVTPAVVAYLEEGAPLVGTEARRRRLVDPSRTIHGIKRLLGRDVAEPAVQDLLPYLPYTVVPGPSGKACVKVGEIVYSASEVAAVILQSLKQRAEAFLGESVRKTVLVVPASFSDAQRLASRLAAQVAGLEVVRLINAPTAGAVLHAHGQNVKQRLLVYALGGGSMDASVVDVDGAVVHVLGTSGDSMLGGDALDRHIFGVLRKRFLERHGVDLGEDPVASQRLWGAAESSKIHLSDNPSVEVRLREMAYGDGHPLDLVDEISRKEVEAAFKETFKRSLGHVDAAMQAARLDKAGLDGVLLMGGAAMVPMVVDGVSRATGQEPTLTVHQDGAAALGAALYGQALVREGGAKAPMPVVVVDVQSQSIFVDAGNGTRERLLTRNSTLPAQVRRIFTSSGEDQESLSVRILQGSGQARVGELVVDGLKPQAAGAPRVEVLFEVDPDGVLTVSATDLATGQRTPSPVRVGVEALEQDIVMLRMQRGEVRA